ncbi:MAG: hypothetical protein F6J93_35505 [Oscillatoria sp. SIO1A7]|nr:hypothetical protein [Oscillatoria sp. SIO1A7]
MNKSWMAKLASHYGLARQIYPEDKLAIVFDIDGTILDMRYMVLSLLQAFDKHNNTHFFSRLTIADICVHENQVDRLLDELPVPVSKHAEILEWYRQNRWSSEYILNAHQPFTGVLEVIRWFQLQPNTFVALNTGRPDFLREDTLRALNQLGEEYKVQFSDELLYMNPAGWEKNVLGSKGDGIRKFQKDGYRVLAFVDNEPNNLQAVAEIDLEREILLLHADTIFESKRINLPSRAIKGNAYDLTELIHEKALPQHIQLVWHGINDEANLRQFLAANVAWGECDVRTALTGNHMILRHDSFRDRPPTQEEEWLSFEILLQRLVATGKSVKIDLKSGGEALDKVMKLVDSCGFEESRLWFNGNLEILQEEGFRKLAAAYPNAILQAPVNFLAPLVCSVPEKAKELLDLFGSWGINRFSISWKIENMRPFFDRLNEWGLEINIYNVPDLESFLRAVLLTPRSVTSDFNFPKWHYYGRGSGELGIEREYMEKTDRVLVASQL